MNNCKMIQNEMNADFSEFRYGWIQHSQSLRGVDSGGFLNDATHPGLVLLQLCRYCLKELTVIATQNHEMHQE